MFCENDSLLTTQYRYTYNKTFSIIIIGYPQYIPKINIWKVIKTHKTIKTINSTIRKHKIINYSPRDAPLLDTSHKLSDLFLLSDFFTAHTHTHNLTHTIAQFFSLPTNRTTKTSKAMHHVFKFE